ncbi:MAG: type II toxin-antitoxin system prevent-host-death family antitoxin [Thermoanaerobaculaceae bacterium]|nr:type II toxin-antitoxin system prevent-host-death family antitoxin [Thermoanaerobaculaceae bacterium]
MTLEEARKTLPALAAKVAADGEPVRVSRGRGRRAVVIVSAVELEALRARADQAADDDTLTAADARAVRRGRAAIARGDFKTLEEIEAAAR